MNIRISYQPSKYILTPFGWSDVSSPELIAEFLQKQF